MKNVQNQFRFMGRAYVEAVALSLLGLSSGAVAQLSTSHWTAISTTAMGVTGDIDTAPEQMTIARHALGLHPLRRLQGDDLANAVKVLDMTSSDGVSGQMFRMDVPATMKFKAGNTMCGAEAVRYALVVLQPAKAGADAGLNVAFFSGATMPDLRPEAINNSTRLCGTYSYAQAKAH